MDCSQLRYEKERYFDYPTMHERVDINRRKEERKESGEMFIYEQIEDALDLIFTGNVPNGSYSDSECVLYSRLTEALAKRFKDFAKFYEWMSHVPSCHLYWKHSEEDLLHVFSAIIGYSLSGEQDKI